MRAAKPPAYLLPVIVISQAAGTSLWFAGNAVIGGIQQQIGSQISIAFLTSIIQIGFICGTFVFAFFAVADRYRAVNVFALSSLLGAVANLCLIWLAKDSFSLCALRFLTGFFLAGIYPVGMKIAAEQFPKGLGNAMGFLVGALVLGTALPHGLRALFDSLSWQWVMISTSILAIVGGALIYFLVPETESKQPAKNLKPVKLSGLFHTPTFNAAAIGYFGHMWELYAFWAFVPFAIQLYNNHQPASLPVSLTSFLIIGFGSVCCIIGGQLSKRAGSDKVAKLALIVSGICCLLSPLFFTLNPFLFIILLLIWSGAVIADSPQFSTLVAQTANPRWRGTALTFVTSIGFTITIVSIQLLQALKEHLGIYTFLPLAFGPFIGLVFFRKFKSKL